MNVGNPKNQVGTRSTRFFVFNHNLATRSEDVSSSGKLQTTINSNLGNSYIGWSVCKALNINPNELQGVGNLWAPEIVFPDAAHINSNFDHVIFILQDQLREDATSLPFRRLTNLLSKIKLPVSVFSLGANAFAGSATELVKKLKQDQISFYRELSNRTKTLGIRGDFTASVLEKLKVTNIKIHGCPTYFEKGPKREVKVPAAKEELPVLRLGSYFAQEFRRRGHEYAMQCFEAEKELIEFIYFKCKDSRSREALKKKLNELSQPYAQLVFNELFEGNSHFWSTVWSWKELFRNVRFRLSVGTRVHGTIMALNSGVAAILTNGDYRAKEMAHFLGIPLDQNIGPEIEVEDIEQRIDPHQINKIYQLRFSEYRDWFQNEFSLEPNFKEPPAFSAGITIEKRNRTQIRLDLLKTLPEARFFSRSQKLKFLWRFIT